MEHIKALGMTDEIVGNIVKVFNEHYYPYALLNDVNNWFKTDNKAAAEFKSKLEKLNLNIPTCLDIG